MPIVDMHCDTLTELMIQNKGLLKNDLNIDIEKMQKSDVLCQFFAIFVRLTEFETLDLAWDYMHKAYDNFQNELKINSDKISQVKNYDDIVKNRNNNKISALITVEEGGICDNKISRLEELYKMGIRLITLTWNFENCIGSPNSDDANVMNAGLTKFGKEFAEKMCHLGMLIDVSHLSDGGFWDVVKLCKGPFVASHSNSREITNFRRNLTDDMLKALADKGGVTGINFYSKFLGNDGSGSVEQMVQHIKHIKKVAGIDVLAIGSDFDGFGGNCEIHNSAELLKLTDALKREKFTEEEIEKITYKNAIRVIKEVIK